MMIAGRSEDKNLLGIYIFISVLMLGTIMQAEHIRFWEVGVEASG